MAKDTVAPELKINVAEGTKEIVYRSGEAAPIELPKSLLISGRIDAPRRFNEKRSLLIEKNKCHVLVNREAGTIMLYTDEQNNRQISVKGEILVNEDLKEFAINAGKMWDLKPLLQFLRMRRAFFADRDKHSYLIESLSDYSAKVQKEIDLKDDRRGNALTRVEKKVSTDVPLNFKMQIEVYKGFGARTFNVDILCDVTDAAIKFWLESVELAELMDTNRDEIIEEELASLEEYVIIEA